MESLNISKLHGSILTAKNGDGEREKLTGFTCESYPDCDVCGDISPELAEDSNTGEENRANENSFDLSTQV